MSRRRYITWPLYRIAVISHRRLPPFLHHCSFLFIPICFSFSPPFSPILSPQGQAATSATAADLTPYTTTPFELIQAIFYPVFLLAVFGREVQIPLPLLL